MKIYNTLSREKEEFKTICTDKITMYTCGPTVYNYIHIGNARPMVIFDALRSYFEYRGYNVIFVQNFTDVDDKIINKANEEGLSIFQISEKYMHEYQVDAKGLNVKTPTVQPTVTENMDNIIAFIKMLEENEFTYVVNDSVYFRTKKFDGYGKLSHMPLEDLEAGARVNVDDEKEDPMDFVVWKAAKPNEPSWNSPWGKGRPGWHIECSAMARAYLGDNIDLHCGGQDLIFPHHENEIAQSECATGKPFANYWMHNGYINIDNRKMSKSAGNFFTTRDVAEKYGYEPIRYMMIQAHYRTPINYSLDLIEQCRSALDRLYQFRENIAFALQSAPGGKMTEEEKVMVDAKKTAFIEAMEDDFNTADAVSSIFELVREVNPSIAGEALGSKEYLEYAQKIFEELINVLGLLYERKTSNEIPEEVISLVEARKEARKNKDFKKADQLRDEILALGYVVEETRQGTKVTKA